MKQDVIIITSRILMRFLMDWLWLLLFRYTLRGRITEGVRAKLSFELEVCLIPRVNMVGIRRKRLKGDAWCYKRVCEEVLRMASIQAAT